MSGSIDNRLNDNGSDDRNTASDGDGIDVDDSFGFNEDGTVGERMLSIDRYIDYHHLT